MTDRSPLTIHVAQFNPTLGDLKGNAAHIIEILDEAVDAENRLFVFPECALTGYPLEDLVLKPQFLQDAIEELRDIETIVRDKRTNLIIGCPYWPAQDGFEGAAPYNAAFVITPLRTSIITKHELPNYDVFDEKRVFASGPVDQGPVEIAGYRFGIMICEDIWEPNRAAYLKDKNCDGLIAINGSPFHAGKVEMRHDAVSARIRETGLPLLYVNLVGGQDELVFDGGSFAACSQFDQQAGPFISMQAVRFNEAVIPVTFQDEPTGALFRGPTDINVGKSRDEEDFSAMVLGLRDYVEKNHFWGALVASSGGIDSALTIAVAHVALKDHPLYTVSLPAKVTSKESNDLAAELMRNLKESSYGRSLTGEGKRVHTQIPIADTVSLIENRIEDGLEALGLFDSRSNMRIMYQNIQPRERGVIMMGLSNASRALLLTTGNKSEMSIGYATLYGDMCGGFSVLGDAYKMRVYALARYYNRAYGQTHGRIPQGIIDRPPTAELEEDQLDSKELPPYPILDVMLEAMIERELSSSEVIRVVQEAQYDTMEDLNRVKNYAWVSTAVAKITNMIKRAEFKRRQAPLSVKLTRHNFGRGRRYPITNNWKS